MAALSSVIPAKAGTHDLRNILKRRCSWIPAFAGMTEEMGMTAMDVGAGVST